MQRGNTVVIVGETKFYLEHRFLYLMVALALFLYYKPSFY